MSDDIRCDGRPRHNAGWRLLIRSGEALLAILLVLLFFLAFIGVVGFSFPQGTSLRYLITDQGWGPRPPASTGLDFELGPSAAPSAPMVARLVRTHRVVKARTSQAVAWAGALPGMTLADRDSVQTFDRSGAEILLAHDSVLRLGENSLVVIHPQDRPTPTAQGAASLLILGGTLEFRSDADPSKRVPLEIATANGGSVRLAAGTNDSQLRVTMNSDATATVSVTRGTVQVLSGGQAVTVVGGQALTMDGKRPPGRPTRVPHAPVVLSPGNGQTIEYRAFPPRVHFAWNGEPGCDAYRLVISRDAQFEEILYDGRTTAPEFTHGNLPQGRYHWRVSALAGHVEGPASTARWLGMVRDDLPPRLQLELPRRIAGAELVLRGSTEPRAEIFVGEQSASVDLHGAFQLRLLLERGLNVVVVEAIDPAGNVSYHSELVNANY